MKKILFSFLILFLFISSASASDWIYVISTPDENRCYVDRDSIVTNKDFIKIWTKISLSIQSRSKAKSTLLRNADYTLSFVEYNCATKESRLLSAIFYDKHGTTLDSETSRNSEFSPIAPGSVDEFIYKLICNK